ncbi:MFS transporter [Amycolatopsis thermophila]|uniref:MHS family proline/betaine transporter-like MFS transporter n=1 Tax=Amycolatopsis thermophila TaxID=206084 RepID=A0ABU0F0V0_9PSEU|nr:MFS transporter [Amycolatopsis thermophila]MDQ0381195.1 MHS family proline/betaine transporter-like MFS transporter [Amycolatopsis thermophila]
MTTGNDAIVPSGREDRRAAGGPEPSSVRTPAEVRRVALAGGVGTLIEYYDYALYGYVSTIIAPLFFPGSDPVASLLAVLAVFALSYVVRPLGGIVFGWVGDRFGRRHALMVTVVGIGVANTAIGVLPTYAVAGVLAPVLLVVVRVAQGFFAGGEVGGAATVIAEAAPPGKRARYGAFTPMGTNGGFAIASAAIGIVSGVLATQQLSTWGWRVPFLLGLPLTVICYFARRMLPDIDRRVSLGKHGFPLLSALKNYPGSLLQATALGVGVQGAAYIGSTFISIYLVSNLHYPKSPVYWVTAGVTLFAVALMPFTGRLADRIGTFKVATIGLAGYAIITYPAFLLMDIGNIGLAALGYVAIMVNMAFLQVASFTLTPRLFPDEVRYTGTALATNISVVIAGGTAPYVATWLVQRTSDLRSPYYFVATTCLIGLIAIATMRKRLASEFASPGLR